MLAAVFLKTVPWPQPHPPAKPAERTQPQPPAKPAERSDVAICSGGSSHDALAACGRLIDKGLVRYYFNRAQIHFRNRAYDWAVEDFSAFIRLNPIASRPLTSEA